MRLRLSHLSHLSSMPYLGLCVFSLPNSRIMIVRIRVLYLIIITKSEVWPISHCLWLGHETMALSVCHFIYSSNVLNFYLNTERCLLHGGNTMLKYSIQVLCKQYLRLMKTPTKSSDTTWEGHILRTIQWIISCTIIYFRFQNMMLMYDTQMITYISKSTS